VEAKGVLAFFSSKPVQPCEKVNFLPSLGIYFNQFFFHICKIRYQFGTLLQKKVLISDYHRCSDDEVLLSKRASALEKNVLCQGNNQALLW
jgi:hypothetical protein